MTLYHCILIISYTVYYIIPYTNTQCVFIIFDRAQSDDDDDDAVIKVNEDRRELRRFPNHLSMVTFHVNQVTPN